LFLKKIRTNKIAYACLNSCDGEARGWGNQTGHFPSMVEYAEHLQTEKAKTAASKDTQPVVPGRPDCVLEKFRCNATNSFFIAYACLNSCDGEARGWGNQTGHSPSMVEYAEHLQTESAKTAASKDTQPVVPG
jgi:hypothetical protein